MDRVPPASCDIPGPDQWAALDATAVVERLRSGELTCVALCEHLLERQQRWRDLRAFSWLDAGSVMRQAQAVDRARADGRDLGPLAGLPIAVKDNINTLGHATTAGTPSLERFLPEQDAPVWRRLKAQGAVLFGKTNMHELAAGGTSSNPVFGAVRNPRGLDRIPGGSSGGSAAAVAAHLVPAALGTDTSGSVRMPAAMCGIAGLRPTTGHRPAYSNDGVVPLVRFIDTIGPMARSVRDLALLHGAIAGQPAAAVPAIGQLRLGMAQAPFWQDLDDRVQQACSDAIRQLAEAGATLVMLDVQHLAERVIALQRRLGAARRLRDLHAFLEEQRAAVSLDTVLGSIASADVREVYALTSAVPEDGSWAAEFDALLAEYSDLLGRHGVQALVYPSSPVTAPLVRERGDRFDDEIELNGRKVNTSATTSRHARFAAGLGVPALSLPCGRPPGLPVGLELSGLPGRDAELIALGRSIESALRASS